MSKRQRKQTTLGVSPVRFELLEKREMLSVTTATKLAAATENVEFGQTVKFTATVTGDSGTPDGTVTFQDGSDVLGTASIDTNTNQAVFSTSALADGTHNVTAVYAGTVTFASSTSSSVSEKVVSADTTTSVTVSPINALRLTAVTFTAKVQAVSPGGGVPTGTVTFTTTNGVNLGSANLDGTGTAVLTDSSLLTAKYQVVATYSGDSGHNGSAGSAWLDMQSPTTTVVTASASPTAGQPITLTAVVSNASGYAMAGIITFMDGSTVLGTATLIHQQNTATFTTSALTAGDHTITALYGGATGFYMSTSTGLALTVAASTTNVNTATTLVSSENPANVGDSVVLTATVAGADGTIPTGTVTFMDGSTTLGTGTIDATTGEATFTTTTLAAGPHSITASYGGATGYNTSVSTTLTQTVNSTSNVDTTTTLVPSENPAASGDSVTFTATVTGTTGSPTGTVSFEDGTTVIGTADVDSSTGVATFSTSSLAAGPHSITAVYAGATGFNGSTSAALSQAVNAASTSASDTTTGLTTFYGPNAFAGQTAGFTATVASAGGTPSGSVTFLDGTTVLGTVPLDVNGQASYSSSTFSVGAHQITADYSGNTSFNSSTSSATTETITAATTGTTLTTFYGPNATTDQTAGFTATVTALGGGIPAGNVTFLDGTTVLGVVPLDVNGQASYSTMSLSVGKHQITADYAGNASFNTSTSSAITETITQGTNIQTTTTVVSTENPANQGDSVTFTATVTGTSGSPTGTVTFLDGTTTLGTASITSTSGQATFTTSSLSVGPHSITASYGGAAGFDGSTSAALSETVNAVAAVNTTTTLASSENPATAGDSVTFTATVSASAGSPTGTVTFLDGTTTLGTGTIGTGGQAAFTTTTLSTGMHSITASYGGATGFNSSTSAALTENVNAATNADTTTAVTSSTNPANQSDSVTFTATVTSAAGTPTGSVVFMDNDVALGIGSLNSSGQATFTTSTLAAGPQSITASYGGAMGTFSPSTSAPFTQTITASTNISTTTTLASSENPSNNGDEVTFTATVTASTGTPTGTVTFLDGTTTLGTGTINASTGQATFTTTSPLAVGSHTITASYGGAAGFGISPSTPLTQVVNSTSTANTTVSFSSASVPIGTSDQLIAVVAPANAGGPTPTGTVTFTDDVGVTLGTATLNSTGTATFTEYNLYSSTGTTNITASYAGDTNYGSSTGSAELTLTTPTYTTTADGLQYATVTAGSGPQLQTGQNFTADYTLYANGTFNQTSVGSTPFSTTDSVNDVIPGFAEGLTGMQAGETRVMVIPPAIGYGNNPPSGIPDGATLTFIVHLISIG